MHSNDSNIRTSARTQKTGIPYPIPIPLLARLKGTECAACVPVAFVLIYPQTTKTTQERNATMNYENSEAQRRDLINQIIDIYCELPEDKQADLLIRIDEISTKNQSLNKSIAGKFGRLSEDGQKSLIRFVHAMLDRDIEELRKLKAENPDFDSPVIDRAIADIEVGKSARHEIKPILAELPPTEKLPLLIHNINRLDPADCELALSFLKMGRDDT